MGMPATQAYWTVDQVRALPNDGRRYEVVHGELLVSPGPTLPHQEIAGRLYRRFCDHLDAFGGGHCFIAPTSVRGSTTTEVQPDVLVLRPGARLDAKWAKLTDLLLAIEVLSPSTSRADRFTKRRLFQEAGVPTYWIVDQSAGFVEVWTPEAETPELVRTALTWRTSESAPPLTIPIAELFAPL